MIFKWERSWQLLRPLAGLRCLSTAAKGVLNERGLAVYIHWPFCQRICSYCNFNKYVSNSIDHERMASAYEKALWRELDHAKHPRVNSIYIGGGTPSLATPDTIRRIISSVSRFKPLAANVEVGHFCELYWWGKF